MHVRCSVPGILDIRYHWKSEFTDQGHVTSTPGVELIETRGSKTVGNIPARLFLVECQGGGGRKAGFGVGGEPQTVEILILLKRRPVFQQSESVKSVVPPPHHLKSSEVNSSL